MWPEKAKQYNDTYLMIPALGGLPGLNFFCTFVLLKVCLILCLLVCHLFAVKCRVLPRQIKELLISQSSIELFLFLLLLLVKLLVCLTNMVLPEIEEKTGVFAPTI